jgi:hypothetical protein
LLVYGPDLLTAYPRFLFLSESLGYGTSLLRNSNPVSIMSLLTDNKLSIFGGTVFICMIVAFLFLNLFRKTKNFDILYATVPALGVFLNFHTMNSDLVLLTLSIFLIGNYYFNRSKTLLTGLLKCLGVIFLFNLSTWIGIYDLQVVGLIVMLSFFYLTLRSSVNQAV